MVQQAAGPTCEEPPTLDHRAPDRAAGPIGRTNARAVEERASSIVAVGAPVIMVLYVSDEQQVLPETELPLGDPRTSGGVRGSDNGFFQIL